LGYAGVSPSVTFRSVVVMLAVVKSTRHGSVGADEQKDPPPFVV
jgi:hypothetical protein